MKKLLFLIIVCLFLTACGKTTPETQKQNSNDGQDVGQEDLSVGDSINPPMIISNFGSDEEKSVSVEYIDNGDEAPSVIVFTADWDRDQQVYIEGGYEIIEIMETDDAVSLAVMCGDFYSHDTQVMYTLRVEDGILTISEE